jgi:hypothetical protein
VIGQSERKKKRFEMGKVKKKKRKQTKWRIKAIITARAFFPAS